MDNEQRRTDALDNFSTGVNNDTSTYEPLSENAADETRLAQPVGESYEGQTYQQETSTTTAEETARAADVSSDDVSTAERTTDVEDAEAQTEDMQAGQTAAYEAVNAAQADSGQEEAAASSEQAEYVRAEEVGIVTPSQSQTHKPGGKTKRLKFPRGASKLMLPCLSAPLSVVPRVVSLEPRWVAAALSCRLCPHRTIPMKLPMRKTAT